MEKDKETVKFRQIKFDLLRIMSIVAVVACHSIAVVYPYLDSTILPKQSFKNLSIYDQIFSSVVVVIGRIGVPFFFLLSGYFVINRLKMDEKSIVYFYKKRFLKLLLTFEIWMIIYEIFVRVFLHAKSGMLQVIFELLFISKTPTTSASLSSIMWQIWFIPAILGIYLSMPILVVFTKKIPVKIQTMLISISVIINFVFPTLSNSFNVLIDHGFMGSAFGLYVVIGGMIKDDWLKKVSSRSLIAVGVWSFLIALLMQFFANLKLSHMYFIWYNNLFILLTAVSMFELVSRRKDHVRKYDDFVVLLSKLSLGVFLIHRPIQILIQNHLFLTNSNIINFFINLFVTCLTSLLLVLLLNKVKVFRSYLFYGK